MNKVFNTDQIEDILMKVKDSVGGGSIITLNHQKIETVHALTGLGGATGLISAVFTATADFTAGDTITVDGLPYNIQLPDGGSASSSLFVTGSAIAVVIDTEGNKVNFKFAGGGNIDLPADSMVIVASYITNGTFVAPETGKYRITVIGAGGNGDGGRTIEQYERAVGGGGGGSAGWGSMQLELAKDQNIPITVNNSNSSFGSYLSATSGQNASKENGGNGGTATGGDISYSGNKGDNGTESTYLPRGGNGAPVKSPEQSTFLTDTYGVRGLDTDGASVDGLSPVSKSIYAPFGAGGGGGYRDTGIGSSGDGAPGGTGGVIVELILE